MNRLPSFLIIGAMKSATSTLYEQLLRQPGVFLPSLKEPNFFSNDEQYAQGIDWYSSLFAKAFEADILGEASTHYTKLPTYPETVKRIRHWLGHPRLIYVMRDPVDRLISQYVHQWSEREIHCDFDTALEVHPELMAYSCYAHQLTPFIEHFGKESILPVFFDRLTAQPLAEFTRVCRFIGYTGNVQWDDSASRQNVSSERTRRLPLHDLLIEHPIAAKLRRWLVPKALRTKVRKSFGAVNPPELTEESRKQLQMYFDSDLEVLGRWLGVTLNCDNFRTVTATVALEWQ